MVIIVHGKFGYPHIGFPQVPIKATDLELPNSSTDHETLQNHHQSDKEFKAQQMAAGSFTTDTF